MDHPDERSSHVEGHEASFFAFDLGSKFYFRDIFNSYVFVRLQEADRNRVFNIPGVVRFVFCLGKAARVQESEIQLMKEYLDGESLEDARIEQFAVGEEVTFTRGAMKDRTAFVEAIGSTVFGWCCQFSVTGSRPAGPTL